MPDVRIEPGGFSVGVEPGETLMQAAVRAGFRWPTVCGGHASCTVCFVRLRDASAAAPPSPDEITALAPVYARFPKEDPDRLRLACCLRVEGDLIAIKAGVRPGP